MDNTEIKQGLILKPAEPGHWQVGSGLASQRFGGQDLNPSGDWTPYKAQDENQSKGSFDTDACAVFGTMKGWITLANFLGFEDFPKDVSERYSGVECGTTRYGTDPQEVAEITRTKAGVVPQEYMPWTDDIETWDEYYDIKMADSLLPYGAEYLDKFEFGHEWIFAWGSTYTPAQKAQMLKDALKRGTVCVSISGYYQFNNGRLTKPVGAQDGHWVQLLKQDTYGTIHDQYVPFLKELDANYDHNAAKLFFLQRKTPTKKNWYSFVADLFSKLWPK